MIRILGTTLLMFNCGFVQAEIPNGRTITITAYATSFGCGADACYLFIDKSGGEKIQAVCSSARMCGTWADKLGEKDGLDINRKARITLKAEYFESAGENFWHVKNVVLLK